MVDKTPSTEHPQSLIPTGWQSAAARDFDAHRPVAQHEGHLLLDDTGDWDAEYVPDEPDLPGFHGLPPDSGSYMAPEHRYPPEPPAGLGDTGPTGD